MQVYFENKWAAVNLAHLWCIVIGHLILSVTRAWLVICPLPLFVKRSGTDLNCASYAQVDGWEYEDQSWIGDWYNQLASEVHQQWAFCSQIRLSFSFSICSFFLMSHCRIEKSRVEHQMHSMCICWHWDKADTTIRQKTNHDDTSRATNGRWKQKLFSTPSEVVEAYKYCSRWNKRDQTNIMNRNATKSLKYSTVRNSQFEKCSHFRSNHPRWITMEIGS